MARISTPYILNGRLQQPQVGGALLLGSTTTRMGRGLRKPPRKKGNGMTCAKTTTPIRRVAIRKQYSEPVEAAILDVLPNTFRILTMKRTWTGTRIRDFRPANLGIADAAHLRAILKLWHSDPDSVGVAITEFGLVQFGSGLCSYLYDLRDRAPFAEITQPQALADSIPTEAWPGWE